MKKNFSTLLKKKMKKNKVTPAALQKATGIPWATLQDALTKNERKPMVNKNFKKIVLFLGITLEEILETV